MNNQIEISALPKRYAMEVQVLVVDRANGPADILGEVLARLFEPELTIMLASSDDAFSTLDSCEVSLIVVGLGEAQAGRFSLLGKLHTQYASMPVIVIGDKLSHSDLEQCRQHAVRDAIEMPRRAA